MLTRIALRNIALHRLRTLVVGSLIAFGTMLVVMGYALLDSVDAGMQRSIVHSVAGHLQVYSADSKDDVALYGTMGGGDADLATIEDSAALEEAIRSVPGVRNVVPMGLSFSIVFGQTLMDRRLEEMRAAIAADDAEAMDRLLPHIREIVGGLAADLERLAGISSEGAMGDAEKEALALVADDAFWAGFDANRLGLIDVLDNKVAPLMPAHDMLPLRYIGTDPTAFASSFELFEIVEGQEIPPGQRGILLNNGFYESRVKHKTARRFDKLKTARDEEGRLIATDLKMQAWVRQNVTQYQTVTLQFDRDAGAAVRASLQAALGSTEEDLQVLVQTFMAVDDANFDARHKVFYDEIAPHLVIYPIAVGGELVVTAFSRSGYMRSERLKVWGTFEFESLEKSALASGHSVIDLVSFRALYGFSSEALNAEIAEIQKDSGVEDIALEDAEDALFGSDEGASGEAEVADGDIGFDEFADSDIVGRRTAAELARAKGFDPAEMRRGPILNAAVFVDDPGQLPAIGQAIISAAAARGINVKVMPWQAAAGLIGNFMSVIRMTLSIAIALIFIVALVIINNSMVMVTLERTREIGTMRAIGAQRGFILRMLFVETSVLCLIFGALGVLSGAGLIMWMGATGIPATEDVLYFVFGGPYLRPEVGLDHLVRAFSIVVGVSLISTIYPALIATRVSPLEAMHSAE